MLLQKGQQEPSWPGGVPPSRSSADKIKPSSNPVIRFLDYFFGARHTLKQTPRAIQLLSGHVRSGTYHGKPGVKLGPGIKARSISLHGRKVGARSAAGMYDDRKTGGGDTGGEAVAPKSSIAIVP